MRLAAIVLGFALAASAAEEVKVVRYHDRDLIPIKTKLRFTTLVLLPPGEEIDEVSCGDKQYWVIEGKGNILHLKPAKEGATTNVNVVLKSGAVFSFFAEEVGQKGEPDLKVVIGEDEVLRLRGEYKALEAKVATLTAEHQAALGRLKQEQQTSEARHKADLEKRETEIPSRLLAFLTKQTFYYPCYAKTQICVAAAFFTETNTYVIGKLGDSVKFSGYDDQQKYDVNIPYERQGDVYKLARKQERVTVNYLGKSVYFLLR